MDSECFLGKSTLPNQPSDSLIDSDGGPVAAANLVLPILCDSVRSATSAQSKIEDGVKNLYASPEVREDLSLK